MLYRPLASPLHATRAAVAALWALALGAAALLLYHPLALCALTGAILLAGRAAGVGSELGRALRTALIVALPIVLVNVLVTRDGLTVFARLGDLGPFGQGNLTVEALVYGAVIALKVTVLILITALASVAIDPDELLRKCRRFSFRSALTASLAIRMVPLLAADARRLAEAQRTRPPRTADASTDLAAGTEVAGGGRHRGEGARRLHAARERTALIGAVLTGSLDRAMDVAATLEVRGFAAVPRRVRPPAVARRSRLFVAPGRTRSAGMRVRRPWSRHDLAFVASAVAVLALALAGRFAGSARFDAYPLLHIALGAGLVVLCAALALAILLPFADRRGIEL